MRDHLCQSPEEADPLGHGTSDDDDDGDDEGAPSTQGELQEAQKIDILAIDNDYEFDAKGYEAMDKPLAEIEYADIEHIGVEEVAVVFTHEEDVLGTVGPNSRLQVMRSKCMEFGLPVWGVKATIWKRLLTYAESQLQRPLCCGPAATRVEHAQPKSPSAQARRLHELTHCPPQAWCPHCMQGWSREDLHFRRNTPLVGAKSPLVLFDLFFPKTMGDPQKVSDQQSGEHGDHCPVLIGYDVESGATLALPLATKALTGFALKASEEWMRRLARSRMRVRTDVESTCRLLIMNLMKKMPGMLIPDAAPSLSSNPAEAAIKQVESMIITLKSDLEARYSIAISHTSPVFKWLIKHAGFLYSRFFVQQDGFTAYFRLFGHGYQSELVPFGETVMARLSKTRQRTLRGGGRTHFTLVKAIWIGRSESTDEHIVMLPDKKGVTTCRTVKRLDGLHTADRNLLKAVVGTPWRPKPKLIVLVKGLQPKIVSRPTRVVTSPSLAKRARLGYSEEAAAHDEQDESVGDFWDRVSELSDFVSNKDAETEAADAEPAGASSSSAASGSAFEDYINARVNVHDRVHFNELPRPSVSTLRLAELKKRPVSEEHLTVAWGTMDWANKPGLEFASHGELVEAELKHIQSMEEFEVFEPYRVPDGEMFKYKVVDAKFVHDVRHDGNRWVVNARFVGRDFKAVDWADPALIFAPGSTTSLNKLVDILGVKARNHGRSVVQFVIDCTSAYWQAPQGEDILVVPPPSWINHEYMSRKGMMWRLKRQLPGQIGAEARWNETLVSALEACGFVAHTGNPQILYCKFGDMVIETHQDNMHGVGDTDQVAFFIEQFQKLVLCKHNVLKDQQTYYHLKKPRCTVSQIADGQEVFASGTLVRSNPKHLKQIRIILGMESAKAVVTPNTPVLMEAFRAADDLQICLENEVKEKYQKCTGILLYTASELMSVQFEICLLSQKMQNPTESAYALLKRVVRYLIGCHNDQVLLVPDRSCREPARVMLRGFSHSGRAGDLNDGKSQSSVKISLDGMWLYSKSSKQGNVSTSSEMAAFLAVVSCAEELLNIRSVLLHCGMEVDTYLYTESAAASCMTHRPDFGKLMGIETKFLWLQQYVEDRTIRVMTVPTRMNPAHLGTKSLSRQRLQDLKTRFKIGPHHPNWLKDPDLTPGEKSVEEKARINQTARIKLGSSGPSAFVMRTGATLLGMASFIEGGTTIPFMAGESESLQLALALKKIEELEGSSLNVNQIVVMWFLMLIGFITMATCMVGLRVMWSWREAPRTSTTNMSDWQILNHHTFWDTMEPEVTKVRRLFRRIVATQNMCT